MKWSLQFTVVFNIYTYFDKVMDEFKEGSSSWPVGVIYVGGLLQLIVGLEKLKFCMLNMLAN